MAILKLTGDIQNRLFIELAILTNCSGFSILCVSVVKVTKTTNTVTYPSHSTIADNLYTPVLPLRHFNPFLHRQMATPAALIASGTE